MLSRANHRSMSKRPAKGSSNEPEALAGSSIRVVSNRTGIAPDTLRMWERRYDFPRPSPRPGGSRLYSEDDGARLNLVARAMEAGFRPSEVVTLALTELAKLVDVSVAEAPARPSTRPTPRGAAAPSVDTVVEALLGDDIVGVRALLRAGAVSLGPRSFVMELAHPLAVRIGGLWAEGKLDVRHEHLLSACITAQLHLLLGALDDGARSPTVLLATLPAEPHVLGLEMVAVYLAASLAAPHLLGADTPPDAIVTAARALGVDVVGLSISPAAEGRATARAVKAVLEALPESIELWLGGAGARAMEAVAPTARVVSTWSELDAALAAWRARLP